MPQSLAALERQRAAILSEILHLGDFRSGSISATSGRCGQPNCRCHQPDQPPHGPHYRLTKKVSGKTVTETFSSPADRRKAERQVAEFHRFQQLSRQLLEVSRAFDGIRWLAGRGSIKVKLTDITKQEVKSQLQTKIARARGAIRKGGYLLDSGVLK